MSARLNFFKFRIFYVVCIGSKYCIFVIQGKSPKTKSFVTFPTCGYYQQLFNDQNLFQLLHGISKLMRECWASNPAARLTALRVKKSVDTLASKSIDDVKA